MAVCRLTSKCMSTILSDSAAWSCRGFVSATIPSRKKLDKEACEKVIDAAETVKEGTKDVVGEVKRIGKVAANATGTMTADLAQKGFEQAADSVNSEKGKDFLNSAKTAVEVVKDKIEKNIDKK